MVGIFFGKLCLRNKAGHSGGNRINCGLSSQFADFGCTISLIQNVVIIGKIFREEEKFTIGTSIWQTAVLQSLNNVH